MSDLTIPDDIQGIAAQVALQTGAIYDIAPIANAILAERQRCAALVRHDKWGAEIDLREMIASEIDEGTKP